MIGRLARDPLDDLAAVLADQRAALRSGSIQALADLVPRMERALARSTAASDASRLAQLRHLAAENASLLSAAREGVAAVRMKRSAIKDQRLSTYSQTGRLTDQGAASGRVLSRR